MLLWRPSIWHIHMIQVSGVPDFSDLTEGARATSGLRQTGPIDLPKEQLSLD